MVGSWRTTSAAYRTETGLAEGSWGWETSPMRTYGQFCPIARASEVLAERWTPIILRNLLLGCRTFNEIAAGAPLLSRALLTKRLRELQQAGTCRRFSTRWEDGPTNGWT